MPVHTEPPPRIELSTFTSPRPGANVDDTPLPSPAASASGSASSHEEAPSSGSRSRSERHAAPKASVKLVVPDEHGGKSSGWSGLREAASKALGLVTGHRWFSWVGPKLHWTPLKPVIRCATVVSEGTWQEYGQSVPAG